MNITLQETKDIIRTEYETTRTVFHALLNSFSEDDLRRQSKNPGWTNGEILGHMTFGFIVLNALLLMARVWGYFPKWTSVMSGMWNMGTCRPRCSSVSCQRLTGLQRNLSSFWGLW